jgi:tripartite-type tricarboxylate transporter receptor subunit TctC
MRRGMLLAVALLVAGAVALPAYAQTWPDKPVKLIVPYAPGGASDTIARPWGERLTQALGQQFVIENRGGAGGAIGAEAAAKAAPDGYTLLLTPNAPLSVLPQLRKTPYDPQKAFTPIGQVGDLIAGFVIHPSVGVKTMPELIAYAKKNPGKLAYGSAGLGTATHLRIEMLKYKAGIDILHVPYRGSADAIADLLPGNVQMMNEIVVLPHVKAGKLVLLGVNHSTRHPDFPDVPTLTEAGLQGADVPIWYSIWAPTGLPAAIIDKLNKTIVEIAGTDSMKQRMREINVYVPLQTPDEMRARLENDIKANAELIKAANVKLD